MFKVIKIEDQTVFIGKGTDGQFTEIPRSSFGFEPVVGDVVEFYKNEGTYIVSKVDAIGQFAQFAGAGGRSDKSKVAAALLAILLGAVGGYEFYIGDSGKGIMRLFITLILCIPFLTPLNIIINLAWNIINFICILTSNPGSKWHQDAQGRELLD